MAKWDLETGATLAEGERLASGGGVGAVCFWLCGLARSMPRIGE